MRAVYGGRGITVCGRWLESFEAFYADMGARPFPLHEIDRIDNDGNYEPGNVRWATRDIQARNHRRVRHLQMNGEVLCLSDWARRFGLSHETVSRRLARGWPLAAALSRASDRRARLHPGYRTISAQPPIAHEGL
jgi:hypothetical protein